MGSIASAVPADGDARGRGAGAAADHRVGLGAVTHAGAHRRDWRRPAGGVVAGRARPRVVHQVHVRVRGDVDPDHRGDGRSGRPVTQEGRLVIPLGYYLILSGLLFAIGASGVFLRRNVLTLLMSVEIMLNAVNLA